MAEVENRDGTALEANKTDPSELSERSVLLPSIPMRFGLVLRDLIAEAREDMGTFWRGVVSGRVSGRDDHSSTGPRKASPLEDAEELEPKPQPRHPWAERIGERVRVIGSSAIRLGQEGEIRTVGRPPFFDGEIGIDVLFDGSTTYGEWMKPEDLMIVPEVKPNGAREVLPEEIAIGEVVHGDLRQRYSDLASLLGLRSEERTLCAVLGYALDHIEVERRERAHAEQELKSLKAILKKYLGELFPGEAAKTLPSLARIRIHMLEEALRMARKQRDTARMDRSQCLKELGAICDAAQCGCVDACLETIGRLQGESKILSKLYLERQALADLLSCAPGSDIAKSIHDAIVELQARADPAHCNYWPRCQVRLIAADESTRCTLREDHVGSHVFLTHPTA